MEDYIVMHLNKEVAEIRADGTCTVFSDAFMPFDLWLEDGADIDTRVNNLTNFNYWCASRLLSMDRQYAKEILSSLGLSQAVTDRDRAQITLSYHALSLTDVYWVRLSGETLSFDDINLYDHPLTDAFACVSLRGRSLTAQNAELLTEQDTAGDLSTHGIAPKAWVRRNGAFCLLKDGDTRDVEAELLVSRIADCFDIEHVRYAAEEFEGTPVSACRIMTSKERGIVTAKNAGIYAGNHDTTLHDLVMDRDAHGFYTMNIIDYLVGNTDRHWENWGFWVDNSTNEIGRLHPLMDFNKAFTAYESIEGAQCQTSEKRLSQREAAMEAVKAIGLPQIREITGDMFTGSFDDEEIRQMFNKRLQTLKGEL